MLAKKSVLVESLAQRENIRENDSLRGRSQGGGGGDQLRYIPKALKKRPGKPPGLSTGLYDFFGLKAPLNRS